MTPTKEKGKPGRKPVLPPGCVHMTVNLPPGMHTALHEAARRNGLDASTYLRWIIQKWLDDKTLGDGR